MKTIATTTLVLNDAPNQFLSTESVQIDTNPGSIRIYYITTESTLFTGIRLCLCCVMPDFHCKKVATMNARMVLSSV